MSYFDMAIAIGSMTAGIFILVKSPYLRAVIFECVFHPLSDGWIDREEDGSVDVHRGETLAEYMLVGSLEALEETQRAVKEAERNSFGTQTQSSDSSPWWAYAGAAAAAGIGFVSAYLLGRDNRASGGQN